MNPDWQKFLGTHGARIVDGKVSDFGDLAAELVAARDATILTPLPHLGLIECTGDDAKSFLHNQLTSDVNHLAEGSAQHSSWCTAKGRMLASFIFYRNGTDYRALLSADLLAATQKRLQIYVLRSKVKLADLSTSHEFIGLSGPQAETALAKASLPNPAKPMDAQAFANGTVIRLANRSTASANSKKLRGKRRPKALKHMLPTMPMPPNSSSTMVVTWLLSPPTCCTSGSM